MSGSESFFCMKLTYNGATKTHISNFQKIKPSDNYQLFVAKIRKTMHCSESMGRISSIFSIKIIYNDTTKNIYQIFKKSNMAAKRGDNN